MQEIGEELIDLNEDNKPTKENKSNKEKKPPNKLKFFIILLIIVLSIIILIYLYITYFSQQKKYKSVIILDFDKTITETDTFEQQINLLPTKEAKDELIRQMYSTENWLSVLSDSYNIFYNLNISIADINNSIDKVNYTSGMLEFFDFLKNKKSKYILVILSAGHSYQINRVLKRNNLNSFFDEIIAFNSYEKNGKIIFEKGNEFSCDFCRNLGMCKKNEFKLLKNKYEKKNIFFDKVYFICDGYVDFCLANNLTKNDELLVRKKFELDDYLYKYGFVKDIKCNIDKWNNGFDLINFFDNL